MAKKQPRKPSYPIHKMGKYCGYDEYENGSIRIARTHSEVMARAMAQHSAVEELLKMVTRCSTELLTTIVETKQKFWDDLQNDYGIDMNDKNWSYSFYNKRVTPTPIKKES